MLFSIDRILVSVMFKFKICWKTEKMYIILHRIHQLQYIFPLEVKFTRTVIGRKKFYEKLPLKIVKEKLIKRSF